MTDATADRPLRLRVEHDDDLKVVAATLASAVVWVSDMRYLPKERRFAAVLNRYRWEQGSAQPGSGQRVRSGLRLDFVERVQTVGIDPRAGDQILELLTLSAEPIGDSLVAVVMVFAGGAKVRIEAECLDCTLDDLTAPWPARMRPDYGLDEA